MLADGQPTIVGIDHGFSFPLQYFRQHGLRDDWPAFLDDFQAHWPTDEDHVYVDFVRNGSAGRGAARAGSSRWRRHVERLSGAKSLFHFDVPGAVAKATHAGLPWLRFLRRRSSPRRTSGRSTGGTSRRDGRLWSRSIRASGIERRNRMAGPMTSTTPSWSPGSYNGQIGTGAWLSG
jgi:hypothetical protein